MRILIVSVLFIISLLLVGSALVSWLSMPSDTQIELLDQARSLRLDY
jgi:hypothetical protein